MGGQQGNKNDQDSLTRSPWEFHPQKNEPYSSDPNDAVFFLLVHLVKRNLALVDEGVECALVAFPLPYPLVAKEDVHLACK